MAITKIEVENLTVFEKMEMNVNANVNVLIGENGTGKTHLLKFINITLQPTYSTEDSPTGNQIFGIDKLSSLLRKSDDKNARFDVFYDKNKRTTYHLNEATNPSRYVSIHRVKESHSHNFTTEQGVVFDRVVLIPAKDMLTHSKGLPEMKEMHRESMPFDRNYIDIIKKARRWNVAEIPKIAQDIIPQLEDIMDGKVIIENERFLIAKRNGTKIPFDIEAEGIKKFGLIWQLLTNQSITEDTILLWDEPEANINPKLIPVLAEIILELGRNGVQIFLATHDYFLPEYLEVLSKDKDSIAFHSLYKTDKGVQCATSNKFSLLAENAIRAEKVNLYEKATEKVLG